MISIGVGIVACALFLGNKELLQQTVMDTRMTSRSRRVRLRKDSTASSDAKSRGRTTALTDSSDTLSSQSQFSETVSVPPPQKDVNYLNSFPRSPGRLIIVPPEVYTFIRIYYNNPDYLRACLGDEYWAALCTPNALAAVDGKNVFWWELFYFVLDLLVFVLDSFSTRGVILDAILGYAQPERLTKEWRCWK